MSNTAPKKPGVAHQRRSQKASPLKYIGHGKEQKRATLLESIPDAFVSVDAEWKFTYVNQHAEEVLGKTREQLLGRNVWEVIPLPTDSLPYLNAHEAMSRQISLEFRQFHPRLNKWLSVRLYPFHDGLYGF